MLAVPMFFNVLGSFLHKIRFTLFGSYNAVLVGLWWFFRLAVQKADTAEDDKEKSYAFLYSYSLIHPCTKLSLALSSISSKLSFLWKLLPPNVYIHPWVAPYNSKSKSPWRTQSRPFKYSSSNSTLKFRYKCPMSLLTPRCPLYLEIKPWIRSTSLKTSGLSLFCL